MVVIGVGKDFVGMVEEGGFDVVDGGMFSNLIGMCVFWFRFGKFDVVFDLGFDVESSEVLVL